MSVAPTPREIFERAAKEGERRMDESLLELISTSFIAGFTIVLGIAALGTARGHVQPVSEHIAPVVGALAFGLGLVFLVVGRTELFTANFFDPIATVFARDREKVWRQIARLWAVTFLFNLVGGALFALVFTVPGVLPTGADQELIDVAEEFSRRGLWAAFMSAIVGGALVALLSFMLNGTDSVGSRIFMAYVVGFLLALGPFDHVIVSTLHMFFGILFGAPITWARLFTVVGVVTVGNFVGGVGLVALSHVAQAKGADQGKG